jgi:hypothetical protein
MNGLDFDITPEPSPDEAAAVISAIEQALAEDEAFRPPPGLTSAWRRAGADEATA